MTTGLSYFREKLKDLPLDVREAVVNTDYLSGLEEIQVSQKLHIDQAAMMEELTFKLMLGEIDTEDYVLNLTKALNIDSAKSTEIAQAVDIKIMQPIKNELQNIQDENEVVEEETPEDHSSLKAEDILAEVENPQPSVGILHETIMPQKVSAPITPPIPVAPKVTPLPTGWPVPQKTVAVQNPTPTASIAATLNQKLEQPTVSKPVEIKHSIDPYKEAVELN
jgi:hypothetical protein